MVSYEPYKNPTTTNSNISIPDHNNFDKSITLKHTGDAEMLRCWVVNQVLGVLSPLVLLNDYPHLTPYKRISTDLLKYMYRRNIWKTTAGPRLRMGVDETKETNTIKCWRVSKVIYDSASHKVNINLINIFLHICELAYDLYACERVLSISAFTYGPCIPQPSKLVIVETCAIGPISRKRLDIVSSQCSNMLEDAKTMYHSHVYQSPGQGYTRSSR